MATELRAEVEHLAKKIPRWNPTQHSAAEYLMSVITSGNANKIVGVNFNRGPPFTHAVLLVALALVNTTNLRVGVFAHLGFVTETKHLVL